MNDLLQKGAVALKKLALNEELKEYVLNDDQLYRLLRRAADRYIGGETLDETIPKVLDANKNGFKTSIEFMGESTKTAEEANQATQEFLRIVREIKKEELRSTISLDLSHIGLAVSTKLCMENLELLCKATKGKIEVMISAEGVGRTDDVIGVYKKASKKYSNLGITLQAYLYRSKDDLQELIKEQGRIRIVKGAFHTPEGVSMPRGEKLNNVYLDYVEQLLAKGHAFSIATHHHKVQQKAKKLVDKYKPDEQSYEFESLYGIQTEQLKALQKEGYHTKLYFVYGYEWYLYLCNRIAEYPLNLFRALDDVVE